MAEQQQDVDALKRRGRRRLVGAVALVLLAVIVLPMVFDPEPRNAAPPVAVRIPGEDESAFKPKPPPAPKPEPKKAEEQKPAEPRPVEKKAAEPKPAAEKKAEAKPVEIERKRAEAALANAEYVIPVGAFLNPDPVLARLAETKLRYYTEKVATANGTVTRVRVGPFATKAEADKALETLKRLGFKPGNPLTRPG